MAFCEHSNSLHSFSHTYTVFALSYKKKFYERYPLILYFVWIPNTAWILIDGKRYQRAIWFPLINRYIILSIKRGSLSIIILKFRQKVTHNYEWILVVYPQCVP